MAPKTELKTGQNYFTTDGKEVTLLTLLPRDAQARNDAQVVFLDSGESTWRPSTSLVAVRPETANERWARQSDEARRDVQADMATTTDGPYWMSSGGKEITVMFGPNRGLTASFFAIHTYEWGAFQTGIDITEGDARALRDWLNKNVT